MDPNKALESLLEWANDREDPVAADAFLALNDWLSRGGFLPDRWKGLALTEAAKTAHNRAKDHEINHTLTQASLRDARTQMRRITSGLCDVADILDDIEKKL